MAQVGTRGGGKACFASLCYKTWFFKMLFYLSTVYNGLDPLILVSSTVAEADTSPTVGSSALLAGG